MSSETVHYDRIPIAEVVAALAKELRSEICLVSITGWQRPDLNRLPSGDPDGLIEERVRTAYEVVTILKGRLPHETCYPGGWTTWFTYGHPFLGLNEEGTYDAPSTALRENRFEDVRKAARAAFPKEPEPEKVAEEVTATSATDQPAETVPV